MRYSSITNKAVERTNITMPYTYLENAFDPDEIDTICDYFTNNLNFIQSTDSQEEMRVCKFKFFRREEDNDWFFEKLNNIIYKLNDENYGFDLTGYEWIQYTEYHGEDSGKYDFHMDTVLGNSAPNFPTRKLSLTLLLSDSESDYEGGNFEFNMGQENNPLEVKMKKGSIIVFPSFMIHRVTPVTEGIRKSVVVWITGPKFA